MTKGVAPRSKGPVIRYSEKSDCCGRQVAFRNRSLESLTQESFAFGWPWPFPGVRARKMDSYLSISTGHAHADGDFQVADNDRGVTDTLSAGDQRGGETALPLAKGVFGLAVQREGAADADLGAGGDGLGVGQSVFDRFGEPVSFDVGVVVPEGHHALDEVGAVLKGGIEDPAGVVAKPGRIL